MNDAKRYGASAETPLLEVRDIHVRYSGLPVLNGVSLSVRAGECVSVIGANGVGKSTLLRAIMAAQPPFKGEVLFEGKPIQHLRTDQITARGVVYVPEGKLLFGPLTVRENLLLGAYTISDKHRIEKNLQYVFELFPRLLERESQPADTLSGGEQQMVAIGRGLMSNPKILMLDEPSLGLAPLLVEEVLRQVKFLSDQGMTILLIEQNVHEALAMSDRGYVLQGGKILMEGEAKELLGDARLKAAYLAV
jgi:branched-chain amino acid transport system ATP-binding protein